MKVNSAQFTSEDGVGLTVSVTKFSGMKRVFFDISGEDTDIIFNSIHERLWWRLKTAYNILIHGKYQYNISWEPKNNQEDFAQLIASIVSKYDNPSMDGL